MAYIEEDDLSDDEIAVERIVIDERSEARQAREIVSHAMLSASTPLENRDVKRRMLPGLWYCAVNVLIASLEIDDILRLMKDRMSGIIGSAENADAPPRSMSPQEMKTYIKEVGLASETIMEALELAHEAMEKEGIEDRFPETVFDTALRVLIPAWGPDHVRRAIVEQSAVFIRGRAEAVNFMEPVRILDPSAIRRRAAEVQTPTKEHVATPSKPSEFEFKLRPARDRRVRAFLASDVLPNGKAVWAVAMNIRDEAGRFEFRKFGGRIDNPAGSRIAITALHELCLAIAVMTGRSSISIETTDETLARYGETRLSADNSSNERDLPIHDEIEHALSLHDVTFRLVSPALTDSLQESCDHLTREFAQA
jgi:hypothetical protein